MKRLGVAELDEIVEMKARRDRTRVAVRDLEGRLDEKWKRQFEEVRVRRGCARGRGGSPTRHVRAGQCGKKAELLGRKRALAQMRKPRTRKLIEAEVRRTVIFNKGIPGLDPKLGGLSRDEVRDEVVEDMKKNVARQYIERVSARVRVRARAAGQLTRAWPRRS